MTPILFSADTTEFNTQGLGALAETISCKVTEELNGIFELEMQYPATGIRFPDIKDRCIVYAIPSPYRLPQPFRVYRVTSPLNGVVTIYARHISYDLSGFPVTPFTATTAAAALNGLKANAAAPHGFTFWTDKVTKADFTAPVPASTRSLLGGQEGSILDVYGGEFSWDNFVVRLYNQRGQDNGVTIRYGKNLTDINQDRNISNVATGILPYWAGQDGEVIQSDPAIINAPGTYGFTHVIPIDFSSDFQDPPTPKQLAEKGESYVKANNIGVPTVSISVSFIQLDQIPEYEHLRLLEKCDLCDTITVQYEQIGVEAKAKIVKIVTDVLLERYNSIEIGEARTNISDTIANQGQQIEQKPSTSFVQQAVEQLTAAILGAKGGSVRLLDTNNDGEPDTLYIADNPDPAKAIKVWRFNYEGWGASENGYNGPFKLGATLESGIVADFITAGTINANLVKIINLIVDHVVSVNSRFKLEIESSIEKMFDKTYLRYGNFVTAFDGEEGDPLKSFGQINLYKGNVNSNGDYSPSDGTRAYLNPEGLGVSNDKFTVDKNGNANGNITTFDIASYRSIRFSEVIPKRGTSFALTPDWISITNNGTQYWVLGAKA